MLNINIRQLSSGGNYTINVTGEITNHLQIAFTKNIDIHGLLTEILQNTGITDISEVDIKVFGTEGNISSGFYESFGKYTIDTIRLEIYEGHFSMITLGGENVSINKINIQYCDTNLLVLSARNYDIHIGGKCDYCGFQIENITNSILIEGTDINRIAFFNKQGNTEMKIQNLTIYNTSVNDFFISDSSVIDISTLDIQSSKICNGNLGRFNILEKSSIQNTKIENTFLHDITFPADKRNNIIFNSILKGNNYSNIDWGYCISEVLQDEKNISYSSIKETYRMLKHEYDNIGNRTEANKFFAKEMEYHMKSLQASKNWKDYWIAMFQKHTNNFGNNWLLALGWYFCISLIGSIVVTMNIAFGWNFPEWFIGDTLNFNMGKSIITYLNPLPKFDDISSIWYLIISLIKTILVYQIVVALRRISQR